jgi:hypothetical protein
LHFSITCSISSSPSLQILQNPAFSSRPFNRWCYMELFQIFFRINLSYILHSWTSAKHLISSIEKSLYTSYYAMDLVLNL